MKTLLIDLDGTMYRGKQPIKEAMDFYKKALEEKVPVVFLTNNAMRTPEENARHMLEMGYESILPDQFFNSSMAAAAYVRTHLEGNRAFYIGLNGLRDALLSYGFEITDNNPQFVFVGLDPTADYALYSKALGYLLNGARLIGTNEDRMLANGDHFDIGNGAVVKMLEFASGQKSPKIGKPHSWILEACLQRYGLNKEDAIIIGDNLETDIALGYNNQVRTILIESGVHNRKDVDRLNIIPDQIAVSFAELDPRQISES